MVDPVRAPYVCTCEPPALWGPMRWADLDSKDILKSEDNPWTLVTLLKIGINSKSQGHFWKWLHCEWGHLEQLKTMFLFKDNLENENIWQCNNVFSYWEHFWKAKNFCIMRKSKTFLEVMAILKNENILGRGTHPIEKVSILKSERYPCKMMTFSESEDIWSSCDLFKMRCYG